MLDYYFCEECETYHQPNRFINGQILSACECEISTQPSGLDEPSSPINRHANKKQISSNRTAHNNMPYNSHAQVNFNYQNSKAIPNVVQFAPQHIPRVKYENMPFRNIIQQGKTRQTAKIVAKSPQNIKQYQFLSPKTIRQVIPIKKSVSPPIGRSVSPPIMKSQKVIGSRPIINIAKPPPAPIIKTTQQIPVKQMSQKLIPTRTPIYTVRKLTQQQPAFTQSQTMTTQYLHPTLRSIPIMQQHPEMITSLQNLGPPPMPQSPMAHQPMAPSMVLDRVSQQKIQIDDYNQNPVLVLDRVSKSAQIVEERQEEQDGQCCGKFCYH